MTPADRFWSKVRYDHGCLVWTGCKIGGYGQFRTGGEGSARVPAHRWAYEQERGPIPDGMHLDHLCRNPACVNPLHVDPVTPRENTARGRGARRTHCLRGHAYEDLNTRVDPRTGAQQCRACARDRARGAELRSYRCAICGELGHNRRCHKNAARAA